MKPFTLIKLFDLAVAPPELQNTAELQILRRTSADDEPMLKLWVGRKMTTIVPPDCTADVETVSAWEHFLHGWLSQSGAVEGDTVYLTWSTNHAHQAERARLRN